MKRKIFVFLTTAVLMAGAILPASAAGAAEICPQPYHVRCRQTCYPITSCPGEDTPETPVTPEQPETPEAPTLPETPEQPTDSSRISALEREACELVNQQRAAHGLAPLTIRSDLCVKARIKSQDMLDNGYFSHNSPTYGSPFDMMKSLGITYRTAGENIAMGYKTASSVVNAWMDSEGHRANILSGSYTAMGIGYVNGYWTQWFIG